jgi:hypothetical protein
VAAAAHGAGLGPTSGDALLPAAPPGPSPLRKLLQDAPAAAAAAGATAGSVVGGSSDEADEEEMFGPKADREETVAYMTVEAAAEAEAEAELEAELEAEDEATEEEDQEEEEEEEEEETAAAAQHSPAPTPAVALEGMPAAKAAEAAAVVTAAAQQQAWQAGGGVIAGGAAAAEPTFRHSADSIRQLDTSWDFSTLLGGAFLAVGACGLFAMAMGGGKSRGSAPGQSNPSHKYKRVEEEV